ncbi:MAG: ABC transporter ATP-binding protein [Thermoplasmata archaeon]|nr:ABC transporter ATP-binding protein [Thermoplasmata archaeon]
MSISRISSKKKATETEAYESPGEFLEGGPTSVDVRDLSFSYGSAGRTVPVLHGVDFYIGESGFVSILGPNGVGKSTLIHCINKILEPTEGVVYVNDRDVKSIEVKDLAKVMSYVPYSANDSFPLSVADTVMLGRHPYSKWGTLDEDLRIVYDTLRMMGIEDLAMRPFNELSAGQHQKVMLARGFAQQPRILLLDEPTSNLDIKHQLEVTKLLRDLAHQQGILVIMISHDLNIAAKYSDRMILLSEGTIYASGTPKEVITEENLAAVYGVRSKVVEFHGVPHIVLMDEDDED